MQIPQDKKLHFAFGFVICILVGLFLGPVFGYCAAFLAGTGKEIYDHYYGGTVDLMDWFATCLGGFLASLLLTVAA